MGHTKPEDILDLHAELKSIRALLNIKEKSQGVFYFKGTPFLHFHDKDGIRWADVKRAEGWQRLEINFGASRKERLSFLKEVVAVYNLSAVNLKPNSKLNNIK